MNSRIWFTACCLCTALPILAQSSRSQSGLSVSVGPACSLTDVSSSIVSRQSDSSSETVRGVTRFRYLLRTSRAGGSGDVQAAWPGLPSGAVAEWEADLPNATIVQETPANVPVAVGLFGANAHSERYGSLATVRWSLRLPQTQGIPDALGPQIRIQCK